MRWLFRLLLVVLLAAAAGWWWAGRAAGPVIAIRQPTRFVGRSTPLDVTVDAPEARVSSLEIAVEQNGNRHVVFALDQANGQGAPKDAAGRISVTRIIGKAEWPDLQAGPARVVVRAARPVLRGLRQAASEAVRDVQVRLEPPRVEVVSTFHFINQGGAEFVVYRATPSDVESGVRVGQVSYPGFPAAGARIRGDNSTRVAFFALLHDQDPNAPIVVFAHDPAGSEAQAPLDHRTFPKPFARSRIEITDSFLQRVVPAIAATTPDMGLSSAPGDLVTSFLRINGDLRRKNGQALFQLASKTSNEMLWTEPFQPLGNAKVEAKFADSRTYVYGGKDIDHQVHLGFDLAVTTHIPVVAANRGVVLHAGDLGIYGNCIVLDHGLGVQSLYGHLSSIDVNVGQTVEKGQTMGRSGMTGLAAGDHLHFTMLVQGQAVNPVEWWDPKWMQDRVFRKIAEAGGTVATGTSAERRID
jgi:murein DD-endopeptidase MepM/ murein hydrolase activator NlpD